MNKQQQPLLEPAQQQSQQILAASLLVARNRAKTDYRFFTNYVFAASFDNFVGGQFIDDVSDHIDSNNYTMDITARDHYKSTRLYCRVMWRVLRGEAREGWYFSYNQDLGAYHTAKIKEMIKRNPFYFDYRDNKPTADSILDYSAPGSEARVTYNPGGLLAFKRGIHSEDVFVDDALRDPENKLKPLAIEKINRIVSYELLPMVKRGGECRIVGTPQTNQDFFFNDDLLAEGFARTIQPAIVDEPNEVALWPEWRPFHELINIRQARGEKVFAQEYMASPVYAENSYIDRKQLRAVVSDIPNWKLAQHDQLKTVFVTAGFDIGKKVHPSHLAIFARLPHSNSKWRYQQIHSAWLDGWDYRKQVEYLNLCADYFNISVLRYDNTRAEFEGFAEQGLLDKRIFKPVTLTAKNQVSYASQFGSVVEQGRIKLINDPRQTEQILAVNNELDAIQTSGGHGDSFWSVAMAVYETEDKQPKVRHI